MISLIGYRNKRTVIGDIVLDATLERHHLYQNEVSRYPIESGGTIADHIRQIPEVLTIVGHFASNPIRTLVGQLDRRLDPTGMKRIKEAHDRLLTFAGYMLAGQKRPSRNFGMTYLNNLIKIRRGENTGIVAPELPAELTPILIDVVTGLRVYRNMVITRLEFPEKRGELEFTIVLEPVQYVTHELTDSKFIDIPEVAEEVKKKVEPPVDVKSESKSHALKLSTDRESGEISFDKYFIRNSRNFFRTLLGFKLK